MAALSDVDTLAIAVVRDGEPPAGAAEAVAEAGGAVLLVGSGTMRAVAHVPARRVWCAETDTVAPGALAAALAPLLGGIPLVLLPSSADGRDLAPRLADLLDRPLLAHAVRCSDGTAELTRYHSRLGVTVALDGPVVATLDPGAGADPVAGPPEVEEIALVVPEAGADAELLAVEPPDPSTMDLAEAGRIIGGGAGLVPADADGQAAMRLLTEVAAALGASAGATRVVTDAGWMDHARQIGTTGVVTAPDLYVAFGVSGATQHTGGLGHPRHVVSVNTDQSCPMTAMADLGLVADAPAVLAEVAVRLGVRDD
ncbi:mycofactocin-associated electron transfer flavoprotein alpha subunit [Actinokineospora sp.]|uniref:mycofactocin-associated electron transfer flavoprotein alpha subunit n=1 Tax=Actinokineospora sp. TaxID=1872133 RepID=UPI00403791AD